MESAGPFHQDLAVDWVAILVASLFSLFGLACVVLVALQLPGAWLLLGVALLVELVDGWWLGPEPTTFGWPVLLGCAAVAGVGELIEFFAGVVGAQRAGASRRGMTGALIGGIAGALLFTFLLPVPLVGSLVGAVAGSFLGALAGETSGLSPRTMQESYGPAIGAAWGRVWGTVGKLAAGLTVWIWLTLAAFWL